MDSLVAQLQFSAAITGPICLMLVLGMGLKRLGVINDNFIEVGSKLVFQVTLPAMLFLSIVSSKHDFAASSGLIVYGLISGIGVFLLSFWLSNKLVSDRRDRGVTIQGGFRANTAIIALAYVANAYGNDGVALAAIYVAATTLLYNVQAVIALSAYDQTTTGLQSLRVVGRTLTRNPLIIAILLGVACYALAVPIPAMVTDVGRYFANMTLPLALLCTGGSLDIRALRNDSNAAWLACSIKLIVAPLLVTIGALAVGFSGIELGILFLMNAAPTAAASSATPAPARRSSGGGACAAG